MMLAGLSLCSSSVHLIQDSAFSPGLSYSHCTVRVDSLPDREWKETKQQPGTAGPGKMLGCCLVSFHFLWGKLSMHTVYDILKTFGFFDPLPPLSLSQISGFCSFSLLFGDPSPPTTADVMYGSPLTCGSLPRWALAFPRPLRPKPKVPSRLLLGRMEGLRRRRAGRTRGGGAKNLNSPAALKSLPSHSARCSIRPLHHHYCFKRHKSSLLNEK